jgi:hypothetical protein
MKNPVLTLISVIAAIVSYPLHAEDVAPMRSPKVGDVTEFSAGCKRWEVKEVDRGGYLISQCGGLTAYRSIANGYNLRKVTSADGTLLADFNPYQPLVELPLEVGKKWKQFYYNWKLPRGQRVAIDALCRVIAFETVQVAAGALPAYRVDCASVWAVHDVTGIIHGTIWYSPQIGAVVKYTSQDMPGQNFELTAYSLQ